MHDSPHEKSGELTPSQLNEIKLWNGKYPELMKYVDSVILEEFFGRACGDSGCIKEHNSLKLAIFEYFANAHNLPRPNPSMSPLSGDLFANVLKPEDGIKSWLKGIVINVNEKVTSNELKRFVDEFVQPNKADILPEKYTILNDLVYPKYPSGPITTSVPIVHPPIDKASDFPEEIDNAALEKDPPLVQSTPLPDADSVVDASVPVDIDPKPNISSYSEFYRKYEGRQIIELFHDEVLEKLLGSKCNEHDHHGELKGLFLTFIVNKIENSSVEETEAWLEVVKTSFYKKTRTQQFTEFYEQVVKPNRSYIPSDNYNYIQSIVDPSSSSLNNNQSAALPKSAKTSYSPGVIAGIITSLGAVGFLAYQALQHMLVSQQSPVNPVVNLNYPLQGLTSADLQAAS